MQQSENLGLPFIMASQAQKHVTHNEAIRTLDTIVQIKLASRAAVTPPAEPDTGSRYLIASPATDEWLAKEGALATFQDGAWIFIDPLEGWLAWVEDEQQIIIHTQSSWQTVAQYVEDNITTIENLQQLGINTNADANNRLSISAPSSLFNHSGSDHRISINKSNVTDTASLLFQQNFTASGEIGICGDSNLAFKVSPDGTNWHTSMRLSPQSGRADFPQNTFAESLSFNFFQDGGRFAGSPESTSAISGAFVTPSYFYPYNGATFSEQGKFIHNNSSFGGSAGLLESNTEELMQILKSNIVARRYGPEFYVMKIEGGTGTSIHNTHLGVSRYLQFTTRASPVTVNTTRGIWVKALTGSIIIPQTPTSTEVYVDGELQTDNALIYPSDGWKQVAFLGTKDASEFHDYDTTLFKIYAELSANILVALPFLIPAQCRPMPGYLKGRVPSLTAWR